MLDLMEILFTNRFRRSDATQAHHSIWSAQMTDSLPVTVIATRQLENIQKEARRASLGKMGFNQNFPMAVVYRSKQTGEIEIVDLTMKKEARAVEQLLYHKYANDKTSQLMEISLRIPQLESNWNELLLMDPKIPFPIYPSCGKST